jgi:dolichyl-phosphate-mannose--protein O-mannosyl transferase
MISRARISAVISLLFFGALTRFLNLGRPGELVFDEVYYVDGAKDLLAHGVEVDGNNAEFIVHPPMGKWAIAAGIKLFGDNPFGWRAAAAAVGCISILLVFLIAQRLFNSFFVSFITASLMTLDGLHLVMSRTALLDIFLSFFILLTFYWVIREKFWWAGITMGLALATKWSALYVLAALGLYLLIKQRKYLLTIFQFAVVPLSVYLVSWIGWLRSDKGWDRDSGSNALSSLFNYHLEMLNFHTGLTTDHSYQASAWNWLVLGRPTSFFYATPKNCGADSCSQEVLALGTPFLWWFGLVAIFISLGYFIYRREKNIGLILLFLLASYLPWLAFPERTTFYFYAIAFQPFIVLSIGFVLSKALEDETQRALRQRYAVAFVAVIAACFAYFFPLFVAGVMTYQDWYARMWFSNWI